MNIRTVSGLAALTLGLTSISSLLPADSDPTTHSREKRVAYGSPVLPQDLPAMVFLKSSTNPNSFSDCAGFLVSKRWIITSRNCIRNGAGSDPDTAIRNFKAHIYGTMPSYIQFPQNIRVLDTQLTLDRVIVNPIPVVQFGPTTTYTPEETNQDRNNDIALIELTGQCSNIEPFPMSFQFLSEANLNSLDSSSLAQTPFSVAGFGPTEQNKANFGLRQASVTIQPFSELASRYPSLFYSDSPQKNALLYGGHFSIAGPEACGLRDRGGPLLLEQNGVSRIVGLTSSPQFAEDCGNPGEFTGYLRLSPQKDFIISTIGLIEDDKDWEWQSKGSMGRPDGAWHATSFDYIAYAVQEFPCRVQITEDVYHAGRYDIDSATCITLNDNLTVTAHSNFEMPVGTLRYEYRWESGSGSETDFTTCDDNDPIGSGDNGLQPLSCQQYCLAQVEEEGSGLTSSIIAPSSTPLPSPSVSPQPSETVPSLEREMLGVLRNNVCHIPLKEGVVTHMGSFKRLKAFTPPTPPEVCQSPYTATPSIQTQTTQPSPTATPVGTSAPSSAGTQAISVILLLLTAAASLFL